MRLFHFLFKKKADDTSIIYAAVVETSRALPLYEAGAPDTLDGRFDMLVLHLHLVIRHLRTIGQKEADIFAQNLFEYFVQNMDETLREMGVGDVSVGKRVRKMAQAYYGRAVAYDNAFASETAENVQSALIEVLARNLYPEEKTPAPPLMRLAGYALAFEAALGAHSFTQLQAGSLPNICP